MKDPVTFSAPGKVILIGEYAVLEGYQACARAIGVRAKVKVAPTGSSRSSLMAPDVGYERLDFSFADDGTLHWYVDDDREIQRPDVLSLVHEMLIAARAEGAWSPCQLSLDTSAFFGDRRDGKRSKIGLGSSAALTVALDAALQYWLGCIPEGEEETRFSHLLTRHRRIQGGRGSGIDLAASLRGGTFSYRTVDQHIEVRPVVVPPGLEVLCVWTRHSVATGGFLERLATWRRRSPSAYARHMSILGEISGRALIEAAAGNRTGFMEAVEEYCLALERLGAATSLPIVSAEHKRIACLAKTHGLAYKPSGAGGGDIGVAFGDDPGSTQRFREAVLADGFLLLSGDEDPQGVVREESPGHP